MIRIPEDLDNFEKGHEGDSSQILRLHKAAEISSPENIRDLIRSGMSVDARYGTKMTPLMTAAYNEKLENLLTLLDAGADIGARDFVDCTVLHLSCGNNGADCTKTLFEAGADVVARKGEGRIALQAASNAAEEMAFFKIPAISESQVNPCDPDGMAPLHIAAHEGSLCASKAFLDVSVDINCRDNRGYKPILVAADAKRMELVKLLREAGANTRIKGEDVVSLAL